MTLPTFSIILETENLSAADVSGFSSAIASLLKQDLSVSSAEEFVVIDTGELSDSLKEAIKQQYPWIRFLGAPENLSYYEVKQLGAESAVGEVVVYCDADCVYTEGWLRSLLTPMEDPEIEIVAGETTIPVTGIYSMAMALNYILHRQEPKSHLAKTGFYYLNNFAIRRQLLMDIPFPSDLWLYRGSCSIHSRLLRKDGHTIWKQFAATAKHAPPNGFNHYFWRFLVMGHDHFWLDIYFEKLKQNTSQSAKQTLEKISQEVENLTQSSQNIPKYRKSLLVRISQKIRYLTKQVKVYAAEEPNVTKLLPLALPIVVFSQALILIGRTVTRFYPHVVLKAYVSRFEPEYGNKLFAEEPMQKSQSPRLVQ